MTQFLYHTFVCDHDELEPKLNELGAQGWRLHTCEPVVTIGPQGTGLLKTLIVLDMMVVEEDETPKSMERGGGIAMKG